MHLQGLKVARAIDPQSDKGKTSSAGQGPSPLSTPDVEQGIDQKHNGLGRVSRPLGAWEGKRQVEGEL